jgi:hypothetical protein
MCKNLYSLSREKKRSRPDSFRKRRQGGICEEERRGTLFHQ